MSRKRHWAHVFALFLTLTGCGGGGGSGSGGSAPAQEENQNLTLDSELDAKESQEVSASLKSMKEFVIKGDEIKGFEEIFQGTSSASVIEYFNERVNYVLSSNTEMIERAFVNGEQVEPPSNPPGAAMALAVNWSKPLWLLSLLSPSDKVQVKINEELVDIPSTRIGMIQLGDAFVDVNEVIQAATFVHEARHSDCTGGLPASDLERVRNRQKPENDLCGHAHDICPQGHDLEGEAGCDSHPWGAYSIDAVYTASLAITCTSCTEAQKSVAEISTLDTVNRLLFDFEAMLDGELGPPDMSSSNQVK